MTATESRRREEWRKVKTIKLQSRGDWLEATGEDADTLVGELRLSVVNRPGGIVAGIPIHKATAAFAKLRAAGYAVAVENGGLK